MILKCLLLGRLYAFLGEPYDGLQKVGRSGKYCQGRNEHLIELDTIIETMDFGNRC